MATITQNQTQKIVPFLWFNGNAEEATRFYTSVFKNSKVERITPMSTVFELEGQRFYTLNGGPEFTFTPAISFFVNCYTQEEIDELWEKLSEGGRKDRCGWLTDKFGVSWQIVPAVLGEMLGDKDAKRSANVMNAMLKMDKLDITTLQEAYEAESVT